MEMIVRPLQLLGCVPNQHSYLRFNFMHVFGALVCFNNFIRALTGMREPAKLSTESIWVAVRIVGFHSSTMM